MGAGQPRGRRRARALDGRTGESRTRGRSANRSGVLTLEKRHVHVSSLFHRTLVGRDLDVAVRLREAGDIARTFERGKGGAVAEPDGVELMPASGRDDAAAERDADRARRVWRQTSERAQV